MFCIVCTDSIHAPCTHSKHCSIFNSSIYFITSMHTQRNLSSRNVDVYTHSTHTVQSHRNNIFMESRTWFLVTACRLCVWGASETFLTFTQYRSVRCTCENFMAIPFNFGRFVLNTEIVLLFLFCAKRNKYCPLFCSEFSRNYSFIIRLLRTIY